MWVKWTVNIQSEYIQQFIYMCVVKTQTVIYSVNNEMEYFVDSNRGTGGKVDPALHLDLRDGGEAIGFGVSTHCPRLGDERPHRRHE